MKIDKDEGAAKRDLGRGFEGRRIDLDVGHFSYWVRAGAAPTLVLIPGSFNDAYALGGIIDGLDESMQLAVIEVRGHGGGWPPPRGGSIEQFAQDALRVIDELGLDCCYVGGHSIGGMIALEVGRVQPQKVRGIISMEGWTSHQVLSDAFGGDVSSTLSPRQQARNEALRRRVLGRWTDEQIAEFRTYWKKWDGYDFLCRTELPILELYGDRGRNRPSLAQLRIPARANIQVQWMAHVSHNLQLECPEAVARACRDFIARVEQQQPMASAP